jgi:ubiquinone biosynthesis protein COQ4
MTRFVPLTPPPSRPADWRRARASLSAVLEDPERTDSVFELLEAVGGSGDARTVRRFLAEPHSQGLLLRRPRLVEALADRPALAALPRQTLGRAYLEFAESNGFPADGLIDASERGFGAARDDLDETQRWFFDRLNVMHDLWHVVTGYETDEAGELGLLAFTRGQGIASRGLALLIVAGALRAPFSHGFAAQRYMVSAWRRGRSARCLMAQRWEELLGQPLRDVRSALCIAPLVRAHPAGLIRFTPDGSVVHVAPA